MDVALAAPRHGWRMAACPRSNACAREPRRRRGRTGSQDPWLLGVFSSNSPKAKQFGRQDKSWASRRHIGYAPKTQRPDAERRLLRYHAERGNDQKTGRAQGLKSMHGCLIVPTLHVGMRYIGSG